MGRHNVVCYKKFFIDNYVRSLLNLRQGMVYGVHSIITAETMQEFHVRSGFSTLPCASAILNAGTTSSGGDLFTTVVGKRNKASAARSVMQERWIKLKLSSDNFIAI